MGYVTPLTEGIRFEVSKILNTRIPENGWDEVVKSDVEGRIDHKSTLQILMALCKSQEKLENASKS